MTDAQQRWDEAHRQWEAAVTAARATFEASRLEMARKWTADLTADDDRSDVEAAEVESYEADRNERYEWSADQ